jgi:hypothetical protein
MAGRDGLQLSLKGLALKIGIVRINAHLKHLPNLLFKRQRGVRRNGTLRGGICTKPEGADSANARKKTILPHLHHPPAIGTLGF